MRAETTATSAVLTLSVAVAVAGHALAGGAVALGVLPQLLALAAACWLVGEHLADRRDWAVVALAGIQLVVHFSLEAVHSAAVDSTAANPTAAHSGHPAHAHGLPMPAATSSGLAGSLTMATTHLVALLAGVVLIDRTRQWATRVLRILARLVPQLPAEAIAVPAVGRGPRTVRSTPGLVQRRLTSNVSRRGPPGVRTLTALS
ncbi:hypothetical protein Kfla_5752 [Kribbella flavida DSM 17836]|uniref:Uncharacterized protein n=1 Tax=Kribbella flavida (strain DSM 17836 / JCM 10339 / NBRC 14399) TaxID=479435 RepID=D2PQ55_KRIFD|nr:hypothetical protein [Kribbella flavida]ADB34757.1 hypothetical protein Kfla_5752 [Kribbella flavida DSM 17836]